MWSLMCHCECKFVVGRVLLAQCAIGARLINDVTLENHEGAFYLRLAQSVDAE